ncbi:MAG: dephospho-CoA kinase [Verrucomicrobiales bacterium]|nr:dephospho-CoA kinase [Verrucomicrobiales bacterium]
MSAVLAITGGVACGKSQCLQKIKAYCRDSRIFSCDEEVSKLLTEKEIVRSLKGCIGDAVLESNGVINRHFLREKIFESSIVRKQVEDLIHPHVLKRAKAFIGESQNSSMIVIEVPLLYEVDFPIFRDFDVVVGCSEATQLNRLTNIRKLSKDQAIQIVGAQLSVQSKVDRADFVAWNDGALQDFDDQVEIIIDTILSNDTEKYDRRD